MSENDTQDATDRQRQSFFSDVVDELVNNLGFHRRAARMMVFRHADAVLSVFAESMKNGSEGRDIRDPDRHFRRQAARVLVIRTINCHQRGG